MPKVTIHSIDPEIDAAAQYALRKIRKERDHIAKNDAKEGEVCYRGCCIFRGGYWWPNAE